MSVPIPMYMCASLSCEGSNCYEPACDASVANAASTSRW